MQQSRAVLNSSGSPVTIINAYAKICRAAPETLVTFFRPLSIPDFGGDLRGRRLTLKKLETLSAQIVPASKALAVPEQAPQRALATYSSQPETLSNDVSLSEESNPNNILCFYVDNIYSVPTLICQIS